MEAIRIRIGRTRIWHESWVDGTENVRSAVDTGLISDMASNLWYEPMIDLFSKACRSSSLLCRSCNFPIDSELEAICVDGL